MQSVRSHMNKVLLSCRLHFPKMNIISDLLGPGNSLIKCGAQVPYSLNLAELLIVSINTMQQKWQWVASQVRLEKATQLLPGSLGIEPPCFEEAQVAHGKHKNIGSTGLAELFGNSQCQLSCHVSKKSYRWVLRLPDETPETLQRRE